MIRCSGSILLIINVMFFSFVHADIFKPSHLCSKPYKPYQFNSQHEIDNFKYEVERYAQCIEDFIEEQNRASRNHQQAAQEAIQDWNNFVNFVLN